MYFIPWEQAIELSLNGKVSKYSKTYKFKWIVETVTEEIEENSNKNIQDQNAKMKIEDETLIRELEYSSFFDNIPDQFKGIALYQFLLKN